MASKTRTPPRVPLRPAALISESVRMLFRRFGVFFTVTVVLLLPVLLLSLAADAVFLNMSGSGAGYGGSGKVLAPILGSTAGAGLGWLVASIVSGLSGLAVHGAVVGIALNEHAGRPARPLAAIGRAFLTLPLLILFSGALALLLGAVGFGLVWLAEQVGARIGSAVGFGIMLLIFPAALYLFARYAALVPVLIAERPGLRPLSRAAELSRGYRWPMAGGLMLAGLLTMLLNGLFSLAQIVTFGILFDMDSGIRQVRELALLLVRLAGLLGWTLSMSLLGIFLALLYTRLREIREGPSAEKLQEVFE
ncbi:hypothetical protein [Oceanibium sediminis]|uniref:hypothetical protein n=1 Tax=Oceanibium sediminis TaxID=2026339 RepID=UPI000DD43FC5|nr:hypothetical protein [Oceanibium sediminis]